MTATYTETHPTDKDHVRFLVGDTDTSAAKLTDEEITSVLDEQEVGGKAKKYFAAADCLDTLRTMWSSKGAGEVEKQVEDLRLKHGIDQSAAKALEQRISWLRTRGAKLATTHSLFRTVSRKDRYGDNAQT